MRRLKWLFQPVLIFVVAQVSWALLMLVWIRWYVMRNQEIDALIKHFPLSETLASGQWIVLLEGCLLMAIILVGLYVIFVSLRKQTRLNKLQDSILSSVTHELKTPLASIKLSTETMLYRKLTPEESQKFLRRSLLEIERLQKLIDAVLISARLQSENNVSTSENINVIQIIRDSWKKTEERNGENRIWKSDPNLENERFFKRCDPYQLGIVFDNILDNAVKYTSGGGTVTLSIEKSERLLKVKITDSGLGIERKDLRKIFSRFFRADKVATKRVHGSGLGLYLCATILKQMKCKIYATSEGIGKGSTFYVEIPSDPFDY